MSLLAPPRSAPTVPAIGWRLRRPLDQLHRRWRSLALLAALLSVVGAANAWNVQGWPGRVNDDEGTYVAQAWAMLAHGDISHYTYWYDHPFLGWAMIAGYALLTDGFDRAPSAVMVGREFMIGVTLVSSALIYLLARRLRMRRWVAAVVVLLFGLSPLAIFHHRMVFLDNIAIMWTLAAFAIAASPRRSMRAAFFSGACFAAAVLSKETSAILLPALLWLLWQHTDRRTRWWNLAVFATTLAMLVATYPMYALLKNELLPGEGHVSLGWAIWWQLFERSGSGSLLDLDSGTSSLVRSWLDTDPWLLAAGLALLPYGFVSARLRPIATCLLILVLVMVRGGYLPFPYVVALLPFAALLVGGALDALSHPRVLRRTVGLPLVAVTLAAVTLVVPAWSGALDRQARVDGSADSRAATRWVLRNVSRNAVVVTDDYIWLDLMLAGHTRPVWLWKLDTDPAVMRDLVPGGYRDIDYIVLARQAESTLDTLPTLRAGYRSSSLVTSFGGVEIRRVAD